VLEGVRRREFCGVPGTCRWESNEVPGDGFQEEEELMRVPGECCHEREGDFVGERILAYRLSLEGEQGDCPFSLADKQSCLMILLWGECAQKFS
jgi:hypothetical protein